MPRTGDGPDGLERGVAEGEFQLLRLADDRRRKTLRGARRRRGVRGPRGRQLRGPRREQYGRTRDCLAGARVKSSPDPRRTTPVLHRRAVALTNPDHSYVANLVARIGR